MTKNTHLPNAKSHLECQVAIASLAVVIQHESDIEINRKIVKELRSMLDLHERYLNLQEEE